MFSKESDVTVVLTSCGRFDLLEKTLDSFFEHNTYPIRDFILIEDSGKKAVAEAIPSEHRDSIHLIINKPQLGQIMSIDKAYKLIETEYIFHCEDDWLFYRPGFIEDSKKVLEAEPKVLMVWLRSYHHDLFKKHTLLPGKRKLAGRVAYYPIQSVGHGNHCFSFNPALRRRSECPEGGYASLLEKGLTPIGVEDVATKKYIAWEYFSVFLENDAVKHTGFGRWHVQSYETRWQKYRVRAGRMVVIIVMFALGWWIGESG